MAEPDRYATVAQPLATDRTIAQAQDAANKSHQTHSGSLTAFRFSDLVPELRLQIIEVAVTEPEPIQITKPVDDDDDGPEAVMVADWFESDAIARRTPPPPGAPGYCCGEAIKDDVTLFTWLQSVGAQFRGLMGSLELSDADAVTVADDICMTEENVSSFHPTSSVRERLLALGATIKAVDGKPGVHMATFPRVEVEETEDAVH